MKYEIMSAQWEWIGKSVPNVDTCSLLISPMYLVVAVVVVAVVAVVEVER